MRQERMSGKTLYEEMKSDKRTLHRRTYLEKKRGIPIKHRKPLDLSPYTFMLEKQNGVCAICRGHDRAGKSLSIDHDHRTGYVRGLLCGSCNRGLGMFQDNTSKLLSAVRYLKYGN